MAISMTTYKFTKNDLWPGYVVKLRNGDIRKVLEIGRQGAKILLNSNGAWNYISDWDSDLTASVYILGLGFSATSTEKHKSFDIVEVYGHIKDTDHYCFENDISTDYRPLLWSRTPIKKMTVSEIEKELGYRIEIVSEEEK